MKNKTRLNKIWNLLSRNILSSWIIIASMWIVALAAAPEWWYLPWTTLNPDCAPWVENCTVNAWISGWKFVDWTNTADAIFSGWTVWIGTNAPNSGYNLESYWSWILVQSIWWEMTSIWGWWLTIDKVWQTNWFAWISLKDDIQNWRMVKHNNGDFHIQDVTAWQTKPLVIEKWTGNIWIWWIVPSIWWEQDLKLDVEWAIWWTSFCDEDGNNCSTASELASAVSGGGKFVTWSGWVNAVYEGGNIGIGTDDPGSKLHINGTVWIWITWNTELIPNVNITDLPIGSTHMWFVLEGPTNANILFDLKNNGETDGIWFRYSSNQDTVIDSYAMAIKWNGNVWIWTTTPTAKLHVSGDAKILWWSADSWLTVSNSTDGINIKTYAWAEDTARFSSTWWAWDIMSLNLDNGHVWIWVVNPTAELHVAAADLDNPGLRVTNDSNVSRAYLWDPGGTNIGSLKLYNSWWTETVSFLGNWSSYVNSGNLWLWTTNPRAKLEINDWWASDPGYASSDRLIVNSDANTVINVTSPSWNTWAYYFSDPDDRDAWGIAYSHINDSMIFRVNWVNRATIHSDWDFVINSLAWTGNAYACLDSGGTLYRSATACN